MDREKQAQDAYYREHPDPLTRARIEAEAALEAQREAYAQKLITEEQQLQNMFSLRKQKATDEARETSLDIERKGVELQLKEKELADATSQEAILQKQVERMQLLKEKADLSRAPEDEAIVVIEKAKTKAMQIVGKQVGNAQFQMIYQALSEDFPGAAEKAVEDAMAKDPNATSEDMAAALELLATRNTLVVKEIQEAINSGLYSDEVTSALQEYLDSLMPAVSIDSSGRVVYRNRR